MHCVNYMCELYLNKTALESFYLFGRHIFIINLKRNELVGGGMGRISSDQLTFQGLYLSSLHWSPAFKKKKKKQLPFLVRVRSLWLVAQMTEILSGFFVLQTYHFKNEVFF